MRDGVMSMGAIADQVPANLTPAQLFYYERLVKVLDEKYTSGWRQWQLRRMSYQQLFGPVMEEAVEAQILLVFPVAMMSEVFGGDYGHMRVCDLRVLHSLLMRWELGRALVVLPRYVHDAIHVVDHFSGMFMNPLVMRRYTQALVCEDRAELHECCEDGEELRRGPWARGALTPHQTVLMWNNLSLEDAVAGVQGPRHICDPMPDI